MSDIELVQRALAILARPSTPFMVEVEPEAVTASRGSEPSEACGRVRAVAPIHSGACWACGKSRFWLSIHDKLTCGVCHPPADISLVVEWLEG